MDKSDDDLPTEAERYVMPSRFVESDSLEVQGFVTSALRDLPVDATNRDKAIRLFEAGRSRTPIIALTADVMPGVRDRCLESGMDDYLSKPIKLKALKGALDRWLPSAKAA